MTAMDETAAPIAVGIPVAETPAPPESFRAFFEIHQPTLFRALWLVSRNRHEAEEVMQDAFLRVWERWERVAPMEDPTGYLYRTAMNLFRSRVRRARLALRRVGRAVLPDDELRTVEQRDMLVRALGALTLRQRAAIVLTDYLDLTSEEAGAVLGVRPATVRVLAARARAALERELSVDD